eukprot:scaffold241_cov234-Chaetoceros_neogracile.AAC.5
MVMKFPARICHDDVISGMNNRQSGAICDISTHVSLRHCEVWSAHFVSAISFFISQKRSYFVAALPLFCITKYSTPIMVDKGNGNRDDRPESAKKSKIGSEGR